MVRLSVARPDDPVLARLLSSHPGVQLSDNKSEENLEFVQDGWRRVLRSGDRNEPLKGLVELMDNNPLVCADSASVPSPLATLGLIALGPLFLAGLVTETPILQSNAPLVDSTAYWKTTGYEGEVQVEHEGYETGSVYAAQAMAVIATPSDWSEIDGLFAECFGRSFYVRLHEEGEWDAKLVAGRPWAVYRLRLTPDEPTSLLTVQVMADRNGKCGAAQMVHAMNVMAGFEESLGIPDSNLGV